MFDVPYSSEYLKLMEGKKKEEKKEKVKTILAPFVKCIIFILILILLFTQVFFIHITKGNDMYPAVKDGDLIIGYRLEKPKINDVVVINKDNTSYVGRVIAQTGDIVEIDDSGNVKINGSIQSENVFYNTFIDEESDVTYPITISSDSYFILVDMRKDGTDSRTFGLVSSDDLIGTAISLLRVRGL